MNKLGLMLLFGIVLVQASCTSCKKEDDVYLYLTQEQKDFINTARTGDTVIWESDGGVKDTAVIQPVVFERKFSEGEDNPRVNIESAYYNYAIIGTNKLRQLGKVSVYTNRDDNSLFNTAHYGNSATGIFLNKKFGGKDYMNVYWFLSATGTDTVFWSAEGYLGYDFAGVRVERIK